MQGRASRTRHRSHGHVNCSVRRVTPSHLRHASLSAAAFQFQTPILLPLSPTISISRILVSPGRSSNLAVNKLDSSVLEKISKNRRHLPILELTGDELIEEREKREPALIGTDGIF